MTAESIRVGVIGTGAMGLGVVQSLVRAGYSTFARDIRPEAEQAAIACGARACASPAALASESDVVILLVVSQQQIDDVLFGDDGALSTWRPDAVLVVSSTVAPDYVVALGERLSARKVKLVDAPVSGGPARASAGTLSIMASGADDAMARIEPVLAALAADTFRLGPIPGTAAKCKIVNNLLAAANLAAGAEALALGLALGLDPQRLLDVIGASSGASWIVADRMPRALAGDYAPRAASRILLKDIGIAVDALDVKGHAGPMARAALKVFQLAVAEGLGEEDDAALVKLYWKDRRA